MKQPKKGSQQIADSLSVAKQLRIHVDDLSLDEKVLNLLLPAGQPHDYESQLWDYKEHIPALRTGPTDEDRKRHKYELGEVIKDAVAFHNAYGGYIVFGVADKGQQRVCGCSTSFDLGDFNKRLESYTGISIECLFSLMTAPGQVEGEKIGVLLVPRRPSGAIPIRFKKKGPEKPNGGRCFNEETYVRVRDECRPAAATSEDWQFLHSDRAPPEATVSYRKPNVTSSLPARDPDLVEFVGREDTLASLRTWLSDPRSPVRLVTGIGGLGKTTVCFRFSEEVVESGAGEVEWVIWLTAKRKTYSSLRGQLVNTAQVDFSGLEGLYNAILEYLSHQLPPDVDEPSLDELSDRVVDALYNYTCLIIVDDIDSLLPDEQKEMVAALNSLALRTVGREIPCSRILLTSRIDQGMPPTAVVKIAGLAQADFERFVNNLCKTFKIENISANDMTSLYATTSGSPLFAAAVIRLVYLGENIGNAIETWKGQEGEDVRKFAFEREIARLSGPQSRLLLAVLLLGETSINDLANILEVTTKVVRDRISELQAYHLISTAVKESGDAVIFAPSDLSAVTEILRSHMGSQAALVEQACARAQERSDTDNRSIGSAIRRIVSAWEVDRAEEGLRIARELRARFDKNGDVASVLGQALLRISPPKYTDADREFDIARRLGCSRQELIGDSIKTKTALKDWQGLLNITDSLSSNASARDAPLEANLHACSELIKNAKDRGDHARVAELSLKAVQKISRKFSRLRLEKNFFNDLNSKRSAFARDYLAALDRDNPRAGDKLPVFDGVLRLAEADVVLAELVRIGLSALKAWWGDVERRPVVDLTACSILNRQLNRFDRIERQLEQYGLRHASIFDELSTVKRDLAHRGAILAS